MLLLLLLVLLLLLLLLRSKWPCNGFAKQTSKNCGFFDKENCQKKLSKLDLNFEKSLDCCALKCVMWQSRLFMTALKFFLFLWLQKSGPLNSVLSLPFWAVLCEFFPILTYSCINFRKLANNQRTDKLNANTPKQSL